MNNINNIKYTRCEGGNFPRLICGYCQKPIDLGQHNAIVVWNDEGETRFAHQGQCSFNMSWREGWKYWEPILVFFRNFLHNTGVTPKMLKAKDPFEEMFGVATARRDKKVGVESNAGSHAA